MSSNIQQQPIIKELETISLVGMYETTSIETMDPAAIWQQFMPRKSEVDKCNTNQFYSVQVYNKPYSFQNFDSKAQFQRWAAVAVEERVRIPSGMETIEIPSGTYAVFLHKGTVPEFFKTLEYIHTKWLPNSNYLLDHRPHFEFLDERYLGPMNPKSEEEVWIPIRKK